MTHTDMLAAYRWIGRWEHTDRAPRQGRSLLATRSVSQTPAGFTSSVVVRLVRRACGSTANAELHIR